MRAARVAARVVGIGALVAAVTAGALVPGDPVARAVDPPPVPVAHSPQDDTVCPNLFGYKDTLLKRKTARALMSGVVDMGSYGTMTIPLNPTTNALRPDWRTQSTLDLAGNRYVDSLQWTVPLLRVGLDLTTVQPASPEGPAMTAQFVALLRSWVADQPKPAKRGVWVNHPQYGGFRLAVFVCAARELPDPVDNAWARTQARAELAVQLGHSLAGANNTMLNAQLAAYAAATEVGTAAGRTKARRNVLALLGSLAHRDGSDKEGAPGYGRYLATIEARAARVMEAFGDAQGAASARAAVRRSADFLVAASRPDRRLATIGDTEYQRIPADLFPAASPATWVATSGESGTKPAVRYSDWTGGYAFGRSGWVAGADEASTFYSVRTGRTTPNAAHRHSDTTALTWYSRGVPWVGDPGPYRYDTSALRSYVRGRAAHSALVVSGTPAFVAPARWVRGGTTGGTDTTCLRDPAYERYAQVQVVRCAYYLRKLDALVVQDFVRPTARATQVRQQFVLPPEVGRATARGRQVSMTGTTPSGAERHATASATRAAEVRKATSTRAVLGRTYGTREYGRLLRVPWTAPVGLTSSTTTVLAAQGAAVTATMEGGRRALRVTTAGRSETVRTRFTAFPRPRAKVALHAKKSTVKRGRTIKLAGDVRAAGRRLPGLPVTVQQRLGGTWRKVAADRTNRKGRFTVARPAASAGALVFRTKVGARPGTDGWKKGTSTTVKVRVTKPAKHRSR